MMSKTFLMAVGTLECMPVDRCDVQCEAKSLVRQMKSPTARFSDPDWAGDLMTGQSQSSLHIEASGCPLFSTSRFQAAIAHSSAEAERYEAAAAT